MCLVSAVPLTQQKQGNLLYPGCSPSKSAMTLRSAQMFQLCVSYFMYCSNCFMLSLLSLIPNACATGMEGNTFPLCRRTALRLTLEESVNSLHSYEQWPMFNALNKTSTSLHATRVPSIVKNSSRFFGDNDTELFSCLHPYPFHCFILDASSSAFIFDSSKSRTRSFSSFCVSLWGDSDAGPWKSGSVGSLWGPVFSPCLPLPSPKSNCILWWIWHGQIFPMRHRSDGRGYICIVNSLLLPSVHVTCHKRCQAKAAVTAVVWGFPPHHRNSKWHRHSLTIYPASKTYCTRFALNAVPTSCPGLPVNTHSTDGRLSWSETL